jgi:hypothetical protein
MRLTWEILAGELKALMMVAWLMVVEIIFISPNKTWNYKYYWSPRKAANSAFNPASRTPC